MQKRESERDVNVTIILWPRGFIIIIIIIIYSNVIMILLVAYLPPPYRCGVFGYFACFLLHCACIYHIFPGVCSPTSIPSLHGTCHNVCF